MITKKQSGVLQGIAIMLMLFHHFFLNPNPELFKISNIELLRKSAYFAKICVGLFSFVSGYGLCVAMAVSRKGNVIFNQYKSCFLRYFRLLIKYWFVIFTYVLLCILFFHDSFSISDVLKNVFLISFSINGSWWFMRQYLFFILLAPILDCLFLSFLSKGRKRLYSAFIVIVICTFYAISKLFIPAMDSFYDTIQLTFLLVFVSGFFCKYTDIFSFLERKLSSLNQLVVFLVGVIAIISSITVRVITSTDPSFAKLDFIIVPLFSLGVLLTVDKIKPLSFALCFIGRLSTFMWLIHLLIYKHTMTFVLKISNTPLIFFIIEAILTFSISYILTILFEKTRLIKK